MPDAQAGHEKTLTGMCAAMAGANLIYGAGMLDSGLIFSYAQLVIDNDIFKMIRKVMQGMRVDDENLAVDIIKSVGPGGDFLMQDHTMKYMRTLPSTPNLITRDNRENWLMAGGEGLAERAAAKAADILENHKPMPLSDAEKSALRTIVVESEEEMRAM
ncbi:MAG: trimethylamine methyltransferase family protein, partial [Deltaproteobacteria bacterium]|nr:trimethylamine methyltransferase family protein [Deltaproteobacteria bacterium]